MVLDRLLEIVKFGRLLFVELLLLVKLLGQLCDSVLQLFGLFTFFLIFLSPLLDLDLKEVGLLEGLLQLSL